jgi:hypothetical protein
MLEIQLDAAIQKNHGECVTVMELSETRRKFSSAAWLTEIGEAIRTQKASQESVSKDFK